MLLAGALSAVYVIASPPSSDLAAHLLRARLFASEGFGIWDNWWYGGHHVLLYSVLFPAIAAAITPQLAAALAATTTAALFDALAHGRWGRHAWLGSLWFGAAVTTSLYTGRLTFAFGLAPAAGTALALQRGRAPLAALLALVTALCSPVAALFAALAGAAATIGAWSTRWDARRALPGIAVLVAALGPVALLAIAFPEGGSEPFAFSALWPIPVMAAAAAMVIGRRDKTLLAAVVLYGLGCVAAYLITSGVGSNSARLGVLVAGPLAALLLWPRRRVLLALAPALLYVQWQAPVRQVALAVGNAAGSSAYYQPVLRFLTRQQGPPFRVEIPSTLFHWEAYAVAPRFALARGWERQLDIADNHLFYAKRALTAAAYEQWLHRLAVRFVAVPESKLDYSAVAELRLIDQGLPYLRLVSRTRHWRIYRVVGATAVAQGAAHARALGPDWIALEATRPGTTLLRVRYTPYWSLIEGSGCVAPRGSFTSIFVRRPGPVRIGIRFALGRIGSRSARCS